MIAPRTAPLPRHGHGPLHLSTVVLTGAGFSVDAGLPVTDGLLLRSSAVKAERRANSGHPGRMHGEPPGKACVER
jgi:hypothetical protein